jgi:hypothetical protein
MLPAVGGIARQASQWQLESRRKQQQRSDHYSISPNPSSIFPKSAIGLQLT